MTLSFHPRPGAGKGTNPFADAMSACGNGGARDLPCRQADDFLSASTSCSAAIHNRDVRGIPRQWLRRIRRTMVTPVPQFTTDRMVKEYTRKYYLAK